MGPKSSLEIEGRGGEGWGLGGERELPGLIQEKIKRCYWRSS